MPGSYLQLCPPDLVAISLNRWISGLRSDVPVHFELTACLFVTQILTPDYRDLGMHGGLNLGDSDVALKLRHARDAHGTLDHLVLGDDPFVFV